MPALIWIFGAREHEAIATSLAALVPPVGLLGACEHYRAGNINIPYAALIAAGMFLGAWVGAKVGVAVAPGVRFVFVGDRGADCDLGAVKAS